jgi:hypothetical protein
MFCSSVPRKYVSRRGQLEVQRVTKSFQEAQEPAVDASVCDLRSSGASTAIFIRGRGRHAMENC